MKLRTYLRPVSLAAVAAAVAIGFAGPPADSPKQGRDPELRGAGRAAELGRSPRDDVRADPSVRAVLQRADQGQPGQSVLADGLRVRPVHRNAEADRRRQDLHLQDPAGREIPRRFAADGARCRRVVREDHLPAGGHDQRARRLFRHGRERDRAGRPHRRVQAQVSVGRVHPGAGDAVQLHLLEGEARRRTSAGTRRTSWAPDPSSSRDARPAPSCAASATKTSIVAGQPYLDGFEAIFSNKQAVRVQAIRGDRAAIEFRGFPPKSRDDLVARARQGHHGAGERLELRAPVHAQPQEEAVRRRARTPRADAGGRSLGRLEEAFRRSPSSRRSVASRSRVTRWRRRRRSCEQIPATGPTSTSRAPRPSGCCRRPGSPT